MKVKEMKQKLKRNLEVQHEELKKRQMFEDEKANWEAQQ